MEILSSLHSPSPPPLHHTWPPTQSVKGDFGDGVVEWLCHRPPTVWLKPLKGAAAESRRLLTNKNSTVGTNTQYTWRQINILTVSIPTFSVIPQCNIQFFLQFPHTFHYYGYPNPCVVIIHFHLLSSYIGNCVSLNDSYIRSLHFFSAFTSLHPLFCSLHCFLPDILPPRNGSAINRFDILTYSFDILMH